MTHCMIELSWHTSACHHAMSTRKQITKSRAFEAYTRQLLDVTKHFDFLNGRKFSSAHNARVPSSILTILKIIQKSLIV